MNPTECHSLTQYMKEIEKYPQLTTAEINALFLKLHSDPAARDKIIQSNLKLVIWQARKLSNCGLPLSDLIAEGNCGLMQAIDKYNPAMSRFSTYAVFWIQQKMRRAIHSQVGGIREPEQIKLCRRRVNSFVEAYIEKTGSRPCDETISEETNVSLSIIRRISKGVLRETSLDEPVGECGRMLSETIADPDCLTPLEEAQRSSLSDTINKIMEQTLNEREREVIRQRHGLGVEGNMTLEQVRLNFGVTRERIRQVQGTALKKIRKALQSDGCRQFREELFRDYGISPQNQAS